MTSLEIEVVPSDGRDYYSAENARKAWNEETEFVVCHCWHDGRSEPFSLNRVTATRAHELGVTLVIIKFNRTDNFNQYVRLRPPTKDWW